MHIVVWIASGLLAGWLARLATRSGRAGFVADFALGALGSVVGTLLLDMAGGRIPRAGSPAHVAVSVIGAMILVGAERLVRHVARRTGAATTPVLQDLDTYVRRMGDVERRIVGALMKRETVARNPYDTMSEQATLGQRAADRIAQFGGSWPFLGMFAAFLLGWMVLNAHRNSSFDPFPFILLNLILSCLAAVQAPIIMMSQNRQAAKDRVVAQQDYEVNLKAEMEILSLHAKLDEAHERREAVLSEQEKQHERILARIDARLTELERTLRPPRT
jgi:uncharacterized membrane protein/uncharacterized membrane protein YeaQ/YmgE (transglycosylase-associated protein family)